MTGVRRALGFIRLMAGLWVMLAGVSGVLAEVPHSAPILPAAKASPATPQLSATEASSPPEKAAHSPGMPLDVVLPPDQVVVTYLLKNGYLNPLPENRFYPDNPITRAEFITLLYRATGMKTRFVSEFPYFRDMMTDHWAYLAVEGFRMRNILQGSPTGYFFPEKSMTRLDAAVTLSRTIQAAWLNLSPKEVQETLGVYDASIEGVPATMHLDLARSLYAGFLLPVSRLTTAEAPSTMGLELDTPLSRMDAARMVYRRALMEEADRLPEVEQVAWIPPGIRMTVSPTSAIFQEQLSLGQPLYFALVEALEIPVLHLTLPKGTRLHGHVTELAVNKTVTTVTLDRLYLPSGQFFNLTSAMELRFQPETKRDREQKPFIVPGEHFTVETRSPSTPLLQNLSE